ncbi:MAG: hypothetical protein A2X86_12055 [Bdellovibrionales bacterium GWA2_49_15]|nr:MAG: hypothetical protein A2X86_12055 [Bdellovibrionales bacterium GWA2_49_15]
MLLAENYSLQFAGLNLVKNLNFSFERGAVYRLSGPTGRGKSLFLLSLIQLVDAHYSRLELEGKSCSSFSPEAWRARILYLPQILSLSGEKVSDMFSQAFALQIHRSKKLDYKKLGEYLQFMDLSPAFLNSPVTGLSGGEAQIVAILRALLLTPAIILADESWSAMDRELKQKIIALLKREQGQAFHTLVFISHDETRYFPDEKQFSLD